MDTQEKITLQFDDESKPKRLDVALALAVSHLSRTRLKEVILAGNVSLNGRVSKDPSRIVRGNVCVELRVPVTYDVTAEPEDIPISLLYEDEHLAVVDKPASLVVHPGRGNRSGTLVNALVYKFGTSLSSINGNFRPGIVHRLDKDTSGVLVVAKSDLAHMRLAKQFADHGSSGCLERVYWGLLWGSPFPRFGTVDTLVNRSKTKREKMTVSSVGRRAITHYKVVEVFGASECPIASSAECRLETGRTHQIRLHMSHIGHPILGDKLYGPGFFSKLRKLNTIHTTSDGDEFLPDMFLHQALHAKMLVFSHPISQKKMRFESNLPRYLTRLRDMLRQL